MKELSVLQVCYAYAYMLLIVSLITLNRIRGGKGIIWASMRMTVQLFCASLVLTYVFKYPSRGFVIGILVVMEVFASYTVLKKFKGSLSATLKKVVIVSLVLCSLGSLALFIAFVIRSEPWYNPRYIVPIAGMFIGNSMSGLTLGVKTLIDGVQLQKSYIEEILILGGTPFQSMNGIINNSFDSATISIVNNMLGMGIVFLPGLMTGNLLAGAMPTDAIKFQIAIQCGLFSTIMLSVLIMLRFGYKTFFNSDKQLIYHGKDN